MRGMAWAAVCLALLLGGCGPAEALGERDLCHDHSRDDEAEALPVAQKHAATYGGSPFQADGRQKRGLRLRRRMPG